MILSSRSELTAGAVAGEFDAAAAGPMDGLPGRTGRAPGCARAAAAMRTDSARRMAKTALLLLRKVMGHLRKGWVRLQCAGDTPSDGDFRARLEIFFVLPHSRNTEIVLRR